MENDLLEYLKVHARGELNAVKGYELCELFGIQDAVVRKIVNHLRSNGEKVCSGANGYYYAETRHELHCTIRNLEQRMSGMRKALEGLQAVYAVEYTEQ